MCTIDWQDTLLHLLSTPYDLIKDAENKKGKTQNKL